MRTLSFWVLLVVGFTAPLACSEPRVPVPNHALGDPAKDLESTRESTVRRLAALDPRVAQSQNVIVTTSDREAAAVAHHGSAEEPGIDLFAFTDRLTAIASATRALGDIHRETLPPAARAHYDAFVTFLTDEELRAKAERDDPARATPLVRAVCETWTATTWPNGSLAPHLSRFASRVPRLSPAERDELDTALNQLERYLIESAHTDDVRALSELREALAMASGPARTTTNSDAGR